MPRNKKQFEIYVLDKIAGKMVKTTAMIAPQNSRLFVLPKDAITDIFVVKRSNVFYTKDSAKTAILAFWCRKTLVANEGLEYAKRWKG